MIDVDELLKYKILSFGDIGLCDVNGCMEIPDSQVNFSETIDGVEYIQVPPAFLCHYHFRRFTHLLSWGKLPPDDKEAANA